jgi:phosphoribosylformimino-5-aminoimidazole carboxamide ribotide isomerase
MATLTIYPAIDLKDGQCVRLRRGEMDQATVYASDPAAQARDWQAAGFAWLHVVDLNGAFAGKPVNAAAVRAILGAVDMPVQLGGGIRDMAGIETWLEAGVSRVILGSAAAKNPSLVTRATATWPPRAGPRRPACPPRNSACGSRMPECRLSSLPISVATGC